MAHDAPLPGGEDRLPTPDDDDAAPADSLVATAVGDRCVNCGTPLVSDQRYCVVCGERRGAARFTLPPRSATETGTAAAAAAPARGPRGPRFGQGTTLIAGVATLLLAMLVGVLIGHGINNGQAKTVAAAPVRIITTGGGTSAPSSAATATTGATSGATRKSTKSAPAKKVNAKAAAKKENNAASKVLGGHSTPPPTTKVGQKGSGKGYNKKTGKFDGSFFGQ